MQLEQKFEVISGRDAGFDGVLFYGVSSTGIYCRPSCPSKRPKPENVRFFDSAQDAECAGFRECLRCRPKEIAAAAALVRRVTAHIDSHPGEPFTLEALSAIAGVSPFHLQRTFKKATGVTPKAYMGEQRLKRLGKQLASSATVTEAIYEAGFNASSRAYEQELGMKPGDRRRYGAGLAIRFTVTSTEFGLLLVAATSRGVCAVRLGDSSEQLEQQFRADFRNAELIRGDDELATIIDQILVLIGSSLPHPQIPVDVQATAFQRRVWEYLRKIPRGETRSYSRVAADIGAPSATRAVANACARNEVALIVPCHRVVGANGRLTGFRWGIHRKQQLLKKEQS